MKQLKAIPSVSLRLLNLNQEHPSRKVAIVAIVAIFADIIKLGTISIKKEFKGSKKVNRIRSYASKCSVYLYFLIYQNLLISGKQF